MNGSYVGKSGWLTSISLGCTFGIVKEDGNHNGPNNGDEMKKEIEIRDAEVVEEPTKRYRQPHLRSVTPHTSFLPFVLGCVGFLLISIGIFQSSGQERIVLLVLGFAMSFYALPHLKKHIMGMKHG